MYYLWHFIINKLSATSPPNPNYTSALHSAIKNQSKIVYSKILKTTTRILKFEHKSLRTCTVIYKFYTRSISILCILHNENFDIEIVDILEG